MSSFTSVGRVMTLFQVSLMDQNSRSAGKRAHLLQGFWQRSMHMREPTLAYFMYWQWLALQPHV